MAWHSPVWSARTSRSDEREGDLVGQEHAPFGQCEVAVPPLQEALLEVRGGSRGIDPVDTDALARPQAERDPFEAKLAGVELLLASDRGPFGPDFHEVLDRRPDVPPPAVVAERVRTGPETEIRTAPPVAEVVHALEPRLRPVRDL